MQCVVQDPMCHQFARITNLMCSIVVLQGKHVEDTGANLGAVKTKTTRHARQYMNRRGGFNRPLPAEVTGQKAGRT